MSNFESVESNNIACVTTLEESHPSSRRALRPSTKRASAVSQVLKRLQQERPCLPTPSTFKFRVANNRVSREKAYALAFQTYAAKGYTLPNPQGLLVSKFDTHPDTFTILAEDQQDQPAGTVSLIFDSAQGLPCDPIFAHDLARLRNEGRKIAEVTILFLPHWKYISCHPCPTRNGYR